MHDSPKILAGILVFLAVAGFPFWYGALSGNTKPLAEPVKPAGKKQCVMPVGYMREYHMQLLKEWRDEAVRTGKRPEIAVGGTAYRKSLTGSCMSCHSNKAEFCDRCHTSFGVAPACWECHSFPKEKERAHGM